MKYVIEMDWKPGNRRLWAGVADVTTTFTDKCWKTSSKSQAEQAARRLRYRNAEAVIVHG